MSKLAFLVACALIADAATATAQTNTFPASGNVGIGTTAPASKLHIADTPGWTPYTTYQLQLTTNGYKNADQPTIPIDSAALSYYPANYSVGGAGVWARTLDIRVRGAADGAYGMGVIRLFANPIISGSAETEIMRIQGNGNVGIGTINPVAALHTVSLAGNFAPSLSYGSPAGFIFNSASQELAGGTAPNGPYAYWLQVRTWGSVADPLSLNPLGGNVGIGTISPTRKLHIAGDVQIDGNLYFGSSSQPQSAAFTGVVCGGDYAESVDVAGKRNQYEPGDVLVIAADESGDVAKSSDAYSTAVIGIYSTKPGTVGRRQATPQSANEVPMAMIGIVPTKVSAENGAIHRGDLLVTSSKAGYAMKGTDRARLTGAVVGKAMGRLDSGVGVIEAAVTLQ